MAIIVDGNKIAEEILDEQRLQILRLREEGIIPRLVMILVGRNPASELHVKIKQRRAAEVGIEALVRELSETLNEEDLIAEIKHYNSDPKISGIIIELPLPPQLDKDKILNALNPSLDIDCLTEENQSKLVEGVAIPFVPPAPAAILQILDYYHIDLNRGNVLLIGSGDLVGKPLAAMLLRRGVNFELANRFTENLKELISRADIIVTGVGKPKLLTGDMVKEAVAVIDAGTTGSEQGEVIGDADFDSVSKKASLITPVPGGVGPVTVAMILRNVVSAAESVNSPKPSPRSEREKG